MCALSPANGDAGGGWSAEHCLSYNPVVHNLMNLHRAPQHRDSGHLLFHPSISSTNDLHFKYVLYSKRILCFTYTNFCRLLSLGNLVWPHGWPSFEQEVWREISWGPFQPQSSYDPKSSPLTFFLPTPLFLDWLQVDILNLFIQVSSLSTR